MASLTRARPIAIKPRDTPSDRIGVVACIEVDRGPYGRAIAVCSVDGVDLADWLVRRGHAMDWPRYSKGDYASAQREAEQHERGIWAGSHVEPWRYRACIRRGRGRTLACSDEAQ